MPKHPKALLAVCVAAAALLPDACRASTEFVREDASNDSNGVWLPSAPDYCKTSDNGEYARMSSWGWASLENHSFTPTNVAFSGDKATVNTTVRFRSAGSSALGDEHASIRMADYDNRPVFMVRSGSGWLAVGADGVEPDYDSQYAISFSIDYGYRAYSVTVDGKRLTAFADDRSHFPFADATSVATVKYTGPTDFKSLQGSFETAYPCAWTGAGNGAWTTGANWLSQSPPDGSAQPVFLESAIVANGKRTVQFNSLVELETKGSLAVAAGTSSAPLVFRAASGAAGLTYTNAVAFQGAGSTVARLETGAWTFSNMYVADTAAASACVTNAGGTVTLGILRIGRATSSVGEFCNSAGTLAISNWVSVASGEASCGRLDICGGSVWTRRYPTLGAEKRSSGTMTVRNSGRYSGEGYSGMALLVGSYGDGEFNVTDGGEATLNAQLHMCYVGRDGKATVRVANGGVLTTGTVRHGGGAGSATVTLDGGTIRAYSAGTLVSAHERLRCCTSGANGGTIDNDGKNITVAANFEGDGPLTLAGGGTTTVSADQTGTNALVCAATTCALSEGVTLARIVTVNGGATLSVTGKGNALTNALVLAAGSTVKFGNQVSLVAPAITAASVTLPASGRANVALGSSPNAATLVTKSRGVFAASDLSKLSAPDGYALALSGDSKSIVLYKATAGAGGHYWTGAGADGNWAAGGNWLCGEKPAGSTNAYFNAGLITGPTQVTFNGPEGYEGALYVNAGTETAPVVFKASGANGLSVGGSLAIGKDADSELRVNGGTHRFGGLSMGGASTTSRFAVQGGSVTFNGWTSVGSADSATSHVTFEISGGTVATTSKDLVIAASGKKGSFAKVVVSGSGEYRSNRYIYVGNRSSGHLEIDGGRVFSQRELVFFGTPNEIEAGEDATLALNGGVLEVPCVRCNSASADATFQFDGGTLKSTANGTLIQPSGNLGVSAGANGGTIDNGGKCVTNAVAIGGSGAMTYAGSGTTTLTAAQPGAVALAEGTLRMAPGATLAGAKLTLGADPAKPVTLDYGGQTLSGKTVNINGGLDVTLANGAFALGRVANGSLRVASGATASCSGWIVVGPTDEAAGTAALLDICGGTVSNATRNIGIGDHGALGSSAAVVVRNGGRLATDASHSIIVGSRAAGTLTVTNGTVETKGIVFCENASEVVEGEDSYLNLEKGGALSASYVKFGSGGANATFAFDGGTLRAAAAGDLVQANQRLSYTVGANGGTIDNGGYAVNVKSDIAGTGALTLSGAGTNVFAAAQSGTNALVCAAGTTRVNSGVEFAHPVTVNAGAALSTPGTAKTTLAKVVLKADSVLEIERLASGVTPLSVASLSVAGGVAKLRVGSASPLANGTYTILESAEPLALGISGRGLGVAGLELVDPPATAPGAQCIVEAEGNRLVLRVAGAFEWISSHATGDLCDEDNWTGGRVPGPGDVAYIGVVSDAALTCGAVADAKQFSPYAIVFKADSAKVTISAVDGGSVTNVCAIKNLADDVHHVFNAPVVFADGVEADMPLQDASYVNFSGGAAAYDVKKGCGGKYFGKFTLARADIDWAEKDGASIQNGSTMNLNGAKNISGFGVYTRAILNVDGDIVDCGEGNPATNNVMWRCYGTTMVSGLVRISGDASAYPCSLYSSGTMSARGLRNESSGTFFLNARGAANGKSELKLLVGDKGLAAAQGCGGFCVAAPGANSQGSMAILRPQADFAISAPVGSEDGAVLQVETAYGDVARTVSVESALSGGMSVVVTCAGTNVFRSVSTFTGGLVVTNGATVALADGSKPGAGDVAMASGTTLAARGAANVGGTLALGAGSKLVVSVAKGTCGCVTAGDITAGQTVSVVLDGGLPASAQPILVKGSGAFADGDLARFSLQAAAGRPCFLRMSADMKSLLLVPGYPYAWTGASDGKWATSGNWLDNDVPAAGVAAYFDERFIAANGSRTATFEGMAGSGAIYVDAGTASAPIAFNAASAANGLSSGGALFVGSGADAVLGIAGGSYGFTGLQLGGGGSSTLRVAGGSVTFNGWTCLGTLNDSATSVSRLEISGGAVTNARNHLSIGDKGAAGAVAEVVVTGSGEYYSANNIIVGQRGAGRLVVGGSGLATAGNAVCFFGAPADIEDGENCLVNLDGGVLAARAVQCGNVASDASATLAFNGGTLKATAAGTLIPAHRSLAVSVGENGGVIDANGKSVTIASSIFGSEWVVVTNSAETACVVSFTGANYPPVRVTPGAALSIAGGATTGYLQTDKGGKLILPDTSQRGIVVNSTFRLQSRDIPGDGVVRLVLGALSENVTSVVAKACYITGGNALVSFAQVPEPGVYPIVATTKTALSDDTAAKLTIEDDSLASRCSFGLEDGCIKLTVLPEWPAAWNGGVRPAAAIVGRFAPWRGACNATTFDAAAERAFLLGVAPGADTASEIAAIRKSDGAVTLTASRPLNGANGVIYIDCGSTPANLDRTKVVTPDKNGAITVPLAGDPPAEFYRLRIGY